MHGTFEVSGPIVSCQTKTAKNGGRRFGVIEVATGTAAVDFLVEVEEIESGKYRQGQDVVVTGTIAKKGRYDIQLDAKTFVVADQQKSKAS